MRVRDDDVGDALPRNGADETGQMVVVVRSGIDDRHLSLADDIRASARECERGRVGRDETAQVLRNLRQDAGGRLLAAGGRLASTIVVTGDLFVLTQWFSPRTHPSPTKLVGIGAFVYTPRRNTRRSCRPSRA